MKKLLFSVLLLAVVFSGSIAISKVALADDPVCLPGEVLVNGVCQQQSSSTPLYLIIANQCKVGQVEYSEWSACDRRFGAHGLQWRQIKYPTASGCTPSTYDQLAATRECLE